MSTTRATGIAIDKRVRHPLYKALMFKGWHRYAQCAGMDPDQFDYRPSMTDADAAALCDGCPVLAPCAAEALHPLAHGTVRAGVPISEKRGGYYSTPIRERLAAIASGKFSPGARPTVGVAP